MLALAPIARSIGAAASSARSRLALRSRSERTSLSGRAVAPSAASSSGEIRDGFVTAPPDIGPLSSRYPAGRTDETRTAVGRSAGGGAAVLAPRGDRGDLVGEPRPQLPRQVVPHPLEPDELRSRDVLRERQPAADVDERIVEPVHDQGRNLD